MGSEQELQQKQHQVFGWLLPPWCFFSSVVALHVSYAAGARSALTKQSLRAIPLKCQKKSRSGGVESVIYRATCFTLVSPIRLSIDELFFSTFMLHLRFDKFLHWGIECVLRGFNFPLPLVLFSCLRSREQPVIPCLAQMVVDWWTFFQRLCPIYDLTTCFTLEMEIRSNNFTFLFWCFLAWELL